MTNAELMAKIKAEIERRVDILATVSVKQAKDGDSEMSTYYYGKAVSLEELIPFLSTLESEKPVPNDLEEAADEYAEKHGFRVPYDGSDNFYDDVDVKASKEGFIAGAKWAMRYQEKKIADAYEKGKQEGIRIIRSWESSPGQGGY